VSQPRRQAEDLVDVLRKKLDACRILSHGFSYSGSEKDPIALLIPAANLVLGLPDGKSVSSISSSPSPAPSLSTERSTRRRTCTTKLPSSALRLRKAEDFPSATKE
jgi:hypothetical protein